MRAFTHPVAALLIALALGASPVSAAASSAGTILSRGAPPGFSELEQPRELLVDLYFGSRKVGEAWVVARPGFVNFRDPERILELIPELKLSSEVAARLAGDLEDHAALACSKGNAGECGTLKPEVVDVIFNADTFRLDLFVHPDHLELAEQDDPFLETPATPFSLTSSIGGAIAGSTSATPTYNFQNRTIIGLKNARIRSDSSVASGLGLVIDDLVAELDTRRHRYSGGLFWAPGVDFTGRRRIVGLGFGTQFDTRADSEILEATPLILFLSQPSRVEILIDGRLVTSASYEAGNRAIDSSSLPSGSYPLVLRVREPGGNVREEQRFFVKNAAMPPAGQPVYFGYAGLLANTKKGQPISLSKSLYYQIGAARRLSDSLALDAGILGTQKKAIAQLGGWVATDFARIRAAALVSTEGDKGILLQLGSSGTGGLNFHFDLRRVWSKQGGPLIPLPSYVQNFGSGAPTGAQVTTGSYTQASGSISYSIGGALLSVTGAFRRDSGRRSDYSIGPSLTWPVFHRGGFQLLMTADAQRSRNAMAAYAGFRVLYTSGGYSTLASAGRGSIENRSTGRRTSRAVGSLSAQWFHQDEDRTQIGLEGAVQRDVETTTARANAYVATQLGSARADFVHSVEGRGGSQYGVTFQTGIAMGPGALELGGRDLNQSAVIASVIGPANDAAFDILIDGVPRGRLGVGSRLPIFLEAYRSYRLRLRAVGATPVDYDSAPREVTLFPGNVEHLSWNAEPLVTVFGQAVRPDGTPLVNASITLARGIGQTDEHGYFQVDATARDVLQFRFGETQACEVPLTGLKPQGDFARIGRIVCR